MAQDICEFLSRPASYPEPTTRVELVETHISWVFLTDQFAYKLKKPVHFPFLDFSTLPLREKACRQELALNQRLAPHVYLDVLPIVRDTRGQLQFGKVPRAADAPTVDWVVKMHRLPADCSLDQLLLSKRLNAHDVEQLGETLAQFYLRLPPVAIPDQAYLAQFVAHIRGNESELCQTAYGLDVSRVRRVHGLQLRFLQLCREWLVQRVQEGRIVEGHGDLRPEHIYLTPAPTIIDCIEFNVEFRTLDVADELAFLEMECDRLGAPWIGERILDSYQRGSGDRPGTRLTSFFKCYRACVRAKVNAIRAGQHAGTERTVAAEYLRLADAYAARLGPPLLLVVCGTSGTGKSTLAAAIAESWGARLLPTDVVRRELFPPSTRPEDFGAGVYTTENRRRVYEEVFRRAERDVQQRMTVILDGTFLSRDLRGAALRVARDHGAAGLIVHCDCPADVARQRIEARGARGGSVSEIRSEFVAQQRAANEPDDPAWPSCTVDTTAGLENNRLAIDHCVRAQLGFDPGEE